VRFTSVTVVAAAGAIDFSIAERATSSNGAGFSGVAAMRSYETTGNVHAPTISTDASCSVAVS